MNDASATPRVEIELTAHEGKTSRRERKRPAGPDAAVLPSVPKQPDDEHDGPLRNERNRLIVTALAAGTIALFLGWVLGRAGGDDGAAQTVDNTATTVAREDVDDTGPLLGSSDTRAQVERPTTTRPRPTTTTSLPPTWEITQVKTDPRLDRMTDRIVVLNGENQLAVLDLATREVRTAPPPRSGMASTYPPIAGDDWIVVQFDDGRAPRVYRDDDPAGRQIAVGSSWSNTLLWQLDTDLFWNVEYDFDRQSTSLVEVDVDGETTGTQIYTNSVWPSIADPAGGVIATDVLGAYTVTPAGSRRLPAGRILAVSAGHLLLYSCGATLDDCGLRVIDRATDESRPLPMPAPPYDSVDRLSGWWGQTVSRPTISADGASALLAVSDTRGTGTAVMDLTTGQLTTFDATDQAFDQPFTYPSAVWSADGRFAYLVADSVLTAYDRTTGESFPVVLGDTFPDVRSLTIRPPAPG